MTDRDGAPPIRAAYDGVRFHSPMSPGIHALLPAHQKQDVDGWDNPSMTKKCNLV
jgi:hypothetical protein